MLLWLLPGMAPPMPVDSIKTLLQVDGLDKRTTHIAPDLPDGSGKARASGVGRTCFRAGQRTVRGQVAAARAHRPGNI